MLGYKVFGAGLPGLQVQALCQDVTTAISAAGTTQATATALSAAVNVVSTVGASSGVILYAGTAGDSQLVFNGGANPLRVYPPVGSRINSLSTNAAVIIPINTAIECTCVSSTQWVGMLSR